MLGRCSGTRRFGEGKSVCSLISLILTPHSLNLNASLFKTIDFKTTLTSLLFTADGASLLVGTASGELLIQDLRSLDKLPRKLVVGLSDERVLGLAVQVSGHRKVMICTISDT